VIEQLIALAHEVSMPLTHLAMAFAIALPGVTSAMVYRAPEVADAALTSQRPRPRVSASTQHSC
jgi:hypothetical protein